LGNTKLGALPAAKFSKLDFLGDRRARGNKLNQVFVVSYTRRQHARPSQSISDGLPHAGPFPAKSVGGGKLLIETPGSGGNDDRTFNVYAYSIALSMFRKNGGAR